MQTCISNQNVYLKGSDILNLIVLGAVELRYSVSDMEKYPGHITACYFFDDNGLEVAHITMLSTSPIYYTRVWGHCIKSEYTYCYKWQVFNADSDQIEPKTIYRVI